MAKAGGKSRGQKTIRAQILRRYRSVNPNSYFLHFGRMTFLKGALRVAETLQPRQDKKSSSIEIKENIVRLPHRSGDKITDACVMTAVINNDLALATIPGEPFVQHQINLRKKSPLANTFLLGVAYCGEGSPFLIYVPTVQAVKEGGYGADVNWCSFVSADAGDLMVNAAAAAIEELVNKKK